MSWRLTAVSCWYEIHLKRLAIPTLAHTYPFICRAPCMSRIWSGPSPTRSANGGLFGCLCKLRQGRFALKQLQQAQNATLNLGQPRWSQVCAGDGNAKQVECKQQTNLLQQSWSSESVDHLLRRVFSPHISAMEDWDMSFISHIKSGPEPPGRYSYPASNWIKYRNFKHSLQLLLLKVKRCPCITM